MANRPGRVKKRSLNDSTSSTPSVLKYLKPSADYSGENIARDIINEIIGSVVESQKSKQEKKHAGDSVSSKTVEGWKKQYPWLAVDGDGKDRVLKCTICTEQKVRSVWADGGSMNFQVNSVKRHSLSNEHQKAEAEVATARTRNVNDSEEEDGGECPVSLSDCHLFRTIFYAANSELPSSQINNLLQLQRMNGANIEYQNLSWDTIREIQSCISKVFVKEIVQDIKKSDVYAIMIDESTDLAVHKHLSICVRFVKDGEPVTKFLTNVSLEDGRAHTVLNELIKCLTKLGLDTSKIVSLATDGASTMTGKHTGVGVQLRAKYSPFVVQTHCIAHRLNLAVTDSIKKEDNLLKFREKFSALYHFMSGSSNRTMKLKKIQDLLLEPNLTIKEPHSIRWLGLKNAVEAVYESYNSVLATLAYFAAEKNSVANGLLKYYTQYSTVILVAFMLDVHEVLGVLSKEFQKESIAFSEISPLLDATMGKLDFLESKDGSALKEMKQSIEIKSEEGSQEAYLNGEKLTRFTVQSDSVLLSLRSKYISSLKKSIKHRFRQEDTDIFKNLSILLEPAVISTVDESDHEEALKLVCKHFGEDKVVKIVHGDLCNPEELMEEERPVRKLLDKDKLSQEWPMVKAMLLGSYRKKNTNQVCKRIIMHSEVLPEFSKLCKIAMCMSISSVACERSFSAQNRLKNKYRTSLKSENLDVLIQIQMSGDLSNFDPSKAARLWSSRKRRRKARLTQEYKPRKVAKTSATLSVCSQ